jgi:hypothetical protein
LSDTVVDVDASRAILHLRDMSAVLSYVLLLASGKKPMGTVMFRLTKKGFSWYEQ